MSIRYKLAAVLAIAVAVATLAATGVFLTIEQRTLRAAEEEKVRLLLTDIRSMCGESQLARDPLMLIDYLTLLGKDRKEIASVRVRFAGRWEAVPGFNPPAPGESLRSETIQVPAQSGYDEVLAEIQFSRRVLDARLAAAESALAKELGTASSLVLLIGILLSFPLGYGMTSRLVAIQKAMGEIGQGRLDVKLSERGSDEVARLARGLNAMITRLRELDDMKKTFVASVTHELRSPLYAIESFVKIMLKESKNLSEDDRRQLARIQSNASRLAHFVTSLLDMARIERGKLEYRPRLLDLPRIIEDAAMFHGSRAQEEGKVLQFHEEPGLPQIKADPDLINQVVTNLVSNAIKFTKRGGAIEVRVRRNPQGIECTVSDDGVGIPKAAQEKLFRPFERVANTGHIGGTGLGLSIARTLIEKHRGKIWVESTPGKGSKFIFILPLSDNISLIPSSSA